MGYSYFFTHCCVNSARINQITSRTVDLAVHLIVENHHLIRIERECYIFRDAIFIYEISQLTYDIKIIFHLLWSNRNDRC